MIYIGTDHAGFELKEYIKKILEDSGQDVTDMGAHTYNKDDDYPDFIIPVVKAVRGDSASLGIILGSSGQGEALLANRFSGIRAAIYYGGSKKIITLAKKHNNANILSLGASFISKREAKKAVELFIQTPFSGDARHVRRLKKIADAL